MSSKDEKKSSKKKHDSGKRVKKTSYELLEPIYVMEVNSLGQKFDNHHIYEKPSGSLGGQNLVQRLSPDPNITFCPSNENPHNSLAGSPNISYISQCSGQSATLPQAYINSLNSQTPKPVTNCHYQTAQNPMYPPPQPVAYLSAPPIWPFYPGGHNVISVSPALTTDEDKSKNKKKKKHKSHKLDESKSSSSDVDNDRKREKHARHRRHALRARDTSPRPSKDKTSINNEPVYYQAFPVSDLSRYDRGSMDSRRYSALGGRRMSLREVEAHRRKRREEMEPKYRGGRDYDEEKYTRSVRAGRRPSRHREPDRARSERRRQRSTYQGRSSQRHSSSDDEPYTGTYARSLSITKSRGGTYEKTTNDVLFDLCKKVEDLKECLNSKEKDKKCRCQGQKQQEEVCCCEEQPSCTCCCEESPPTVCCCEESESEEECCACKNDVCHAYQSRGCMCGPRGFMYPPQPSDQTDVFYAQTYNNMNPILYYPPYANLMSPMPQPTFECSYMPLENGMISRVPNSQMMPLPMAQSHPYQQQPMQTYSETTQPSVIKSSSVDSSGDKKKYEQNKPSVKAKSVNTLLSISERAASEENMLSLSKKAFSAYEEATKNDETSSEGPQIIVWPESRRSTKSKLERNKHFEPSSDKNIDETINTDKLSRYGDGNTANSKKWSLMERRNKTLQPDTLNLENSKRRSKLPANVPDSSEENLSKSKNKNGSDQRRQNASDTRRSDARKSEKVPVERKTNGSILKPFSKIVTSSDEQLYKSSYKKSASAKKKSTESPKSEKIVVRRKTHMPKPSSKSVTSSEEELYKSSYKTFTPTKNGSTGMQVVRKSEKIISGRRTSPSTPKPSSKIVTSSVEEWYGSPDRKSTSADKKSTDMRPKPHKSVKSVFGRRPSASIRKLSSDMVPSSVEELYGSADKKSTYVDKKSAGMRPEPHKSVKSVFERKTSVSLRKPSSDLVTSSVEELYGSADKKSTYVDKKSIGVRPEPHKSVKSVVGRRTSPSIPKPPSKVVTSSVEELYGSADKQSTYVDKKSTSMRPKSHKSVKSVFGRRTSTSIRKPSSDIVTSSVEELYETADKKSTYVDKKSTGMRPEPHKSVKSVFERRTSASIRKPSSDLVTSSVEELYGSADKKSSSADKKSTGTRPDAHKSVKSVDVRRTCPSIPKPPSEIVTSSVEELYGSADKRSTSADKKSTSMRPEPHKSVKDVVIRKTSPSFPKRLSKGIASSVGELFKPSGKKSASVDNSKETRPKSRKSLKRIFGRRTSPSIAKPVTTSDEVLCEEDYKKSTVPSEKISSVIRPESCSSERSDGLRTSPSIAKPSTVTTSDEELCDEDYKKSTVPPENKSSVIRPDSYNSERSDVRRTSPSIAKPSTVTTSDEELCDEDYKKSAASPEKRRSASRLESYKSERSDVRRTSPSIAKPSTVTTSDEELCDEDYKKSAAFLEKRRSASRLESYKSERSDVRRTSPSIAKPSTVSISDEELYDQYYKKSAASPEKRRSASRLESYNSERSDVRRTSPSIAKPSTVSISDEELYDQYYKKSAASPEKRRSASRLESYNSERSDVRRTSPSIAKPSTVSISDEELYDLFYKKSASSPETRRSANRPESYNSERSDGRRTSPSIAKPSTVSISDEELYDQDYKKSAASPEKRRSASRLESYNSERSDVRRTSPSIAKPSTVSISDEELYDQDYKKSAASPEKRRSASRLESYNSERSDVRRTSPSIAKPSTVSISDEELYVQDYKKSAASPEKRRSASRLESYNSERSDVRRTSPSIAKPSTVSISDEELYDQDYKKSAASPETRRSVSRLESSISERSDGRRTSPYTSSKPSSIIFSSSSEELSGNRYRKTTITRRRVIGSRNSERSDGGRRSGPSTSKPSTRIVSSSNEDLYKPRYRKTISSETRTTRIWPETNKSETSVITRTKTVTELPASAANSLGDVRNTTFNSGKHDTGDMNSSDEGLNKGSSRKSPISQEHGEISESEEGIFGQKEIESQLSEKNKNSAFEQGQSSRISEPSPDNNASNNRTGENTSSLGEETYIWANVSGYENTNFGRKPKYMMTDASFNKVNLSVNNKDKSNEDRGWLLEDERKASLRPDIYKSYKYIVEADKFRRKPVTKKKRESSLLRLKRILNDETAKPGENRSRSSSFIMERKRSGDEEKSKSRTNEDYGSCSCSLSSSRSYSAQTDAIPGSIGSQSDDINERNYSQTDETSFPRVRDYTNIFPCEYCPCNNETSEMKEGKVNKKNKNIKKEKESSCPSLIFCDLQNILNTSQNQQSTYDILPQVYPFDGFQGEQNIVPQIPPYNAYQDQQHNALNMPPQVPSYGNQPVPVGYQETHPTFQGVAAMLEVAHYTSAVPNSYMPPPLWPTLLNDQAPANTGNTIEDSVSPTNSKKAGSSSTILLEKRDGKIVKQWELRPISMNKEDSSNSRQEKPKKSSMKKSKKSSMKRKENSDNVSKQNVESQTKQKLKKKKVECSSKVAKCKEPSKVSLDRLKVCKDCFDLLQYIQEQLWKPTDLEFFERHGKLTDQEKGKTREVAFEENKWPYELSLDDYSDPWDNYDAFAHDSYSQLPWTNYETLTPETYTPPPVSSRRMVQWGPYLEEQALGGYDSSYEQNSPDNRKKRGKSKKNRRTSYGQRKYKNWRKASEASLKESTSSTRKNMSEEGKERGCKCSNPSCSGYRRRKESGKCRCKKSPEREENSVDIDKKSRRMSDRKEPNKLSFVTLDKQSGNGSTTSNKRSSYKQWNRTVVHDPIKNPVFLPKEEVLAVDNITDKSTSTLRPDKPSGPSRRTGRLSRLRLPKKHNQSQTSYIQESTVKTTVTDGYLLSDVTDKQTSTHFEGTNISEGRNTATKQSTKTSRSTPNNYEKNNTQIQTDDEEKEEHIHPRRRKFSDSCFVEAEKKIEEKTSFCFLSPRCPNNGGRRPYIECIGKDESGYLLYSDESVNKAHTVFRRKKNGKKRGFPVFIRKPRKKKKEKEDTDSPEDGNLDVENNAPTVFRAILSQPKFLHRIHSEDIMDSDETILVTCNNLSNSSNKIISDSSEELSSVLFERNVNNRRYTIRKKTKKKTFPYISIRKAVKNKYNFIKSGLSFKSKLNCRKNTKNNILTKLMNNEKTRDIIPNLTEEQLQNYIKSNRADNSKRLAVIPIQPSKFIIDINSNRYENTSIKSGDDILTKYDQIDADTNTNTKSDVDTIIKIDADTNTSITIDADTNTSTKSDLSTNAKIDADTSTKNDAEINTSFKNDADTNTSPTCSTCPRCNSYPIRDTNIKIYENRITDVNFQCDRGSKIETKQQQSIQEEGRDKIYIHHMKSYQKTIRQTHQPFEIRQRGNRVRTIAINPRVLIIKKYPSIYNKTNEIEVKESKHKVRQKITMATLSSFQIESDEIILRCAEDRKCAKSTVQYSDSLEFQLEKNKKEINLESIKENESDHSQPSEDD